MQNERKDKTPSLLEKGFRIGGAGLMGVAGVLPDTRSVSTADVNQALEAPNLKKHETFQNMPSQNLEQHLNQLGATLNRSNKNPDVPIQSTPGVEHVGTSGTASKGDAFRGKEAQGEQDSTVKIEASQTITETLENLTVTRKWLEQNPQSVKGSTKTTVDAKGGVTGFYTLNGNKYIYKAERDANGKFEKYKAISGDEIPMENPRDIAVSPDGRVRITVGEDPIRSGVGKAVVSYDYKPWKVIANNLPGVGHYAEFITTTINNDLIFMFSTLAPEGQPGKYLLPVNPQTQTEQVQATNSTGSTPGIMSLEIRNSTKEFEVITFRFDTSGFSIEKTNWETRETTIEHIDTITVNGVLINLGTVNGAGRYINPTDGHKHIVTSNLDRDVRYDIDIDSPNKTATERYYANWLDNYGIPNYAPGSLLIFGFQIRQDSQGTLQEWFFGSYTSTVDSLQRAVAGKYPLNMDLSQNPNVINAYDLFPNKQSAVGGRRVIKIDNQVGFDDNLSFAGGKVLLTIDGNVFHLISGFGENPSTPTPTPTPERPFKVYIPTLFKNLVTSSWRKVKRLLGR